MTARRETQTSIFLRASLLSVCFFALAGCPAENTAFVGTQVCLQCHDGVLAPDRADFLDSRHFAVGVDCEACHGPGFAHVRAGGRNGVFIDSLRNVPNAEAHLVCARCHESPTDGFIQSGHFTRDILSCMDCHNVHSTELSMPQVDNSLCLQCHQFIEFPNDDAVDFHTFDFHPVDPAGSGASRCSNCHMPQLEQRDPRGGPRSHSLFTVPPQATLEAAARGDFPVMPNSCAGVAGCHDPDFPGSGPPRDVNNLDLVESLIPLYELIGRIPGEERR